MLPPAPGPQPLRAAKDPASHRLCSVSDSGEDRPHVQLEPSDWWEKVREQLHSLENIYSAPFTNSHLYSEENVPNNLSLP